MTFVFYWFGPICRDNKFYNLYWSDQQAESLKAASTANMLREHFEFLGNILEKEVAKTLKI